VRGVRAPERAAVALEVALVLRDAGELPVEQLLEGTCGPDRDDRGAVCLHLADRLDGLVDHTAHLRARR